MKKQHKIISCVIVGLLLVVLLVECTTPAYIVDGKKAADISNDAFIKENMEAATIQIGDGTYTGKYAYSRKWGWTNKIVDVYEELTTEDGALPEHSSVTIDPQDGKIISFSEVRPYAKIDAIEMMSEEQLKNTVEQIFKDMVDFSQYNTFSCNTPENGAYFHGTYFLSWGVQKEMKCATSVGIYIDKDGFIYYFNVSDYCPPDLTKSFVTEKELDRLVRKKLRRHLKVLSLEDYTYKISGEVLLYYNGKPAIQLLVSITDKLGFIHVIHFYIVKK